MVVHVYRDSMPLKQINYWTNNNLQWSHQQLRTQALMAHKGQWVLVTWTINKPHLPYKTGVHIMQHQPAFRPIPGFISCAKGVTGDCYLIHRMQSDSRPYSKVGRDSAIESTVSSCSCSLCSCLSRSCIANISCHMFWCVKSNLNNKMTMSEGYCSVRVHWTEPKHNYHRSINPLTTPSLSTKVQRTSTDTCLLANIYQFICIHLLAIIRFRTR